MLQALWKKGPLQIEVRKILEERRTITEESTIIKPTIDKFERICVKPDGNCLFRSLSYSLYGDENHHTEIRKNIVDYTVKIYDDVKELLLATCVEIEYKSSTHYKSIMEQDGVFGTDFEIGMFARLYKKHVVLWKLVDGQYSIYAPIIPDEVDSEESVNIVFTGELISGHFDFLKENSSNHYEMKSCNDIISTTPSTFHQSVGLDTDVDHMRNNTVQCSRLSTFSNILTNNKSTSDEKINDNLSQLSISSESLETFTTYKNNVNELKQDSLSKSSRASTVSTRAKECDNASEESKDNYSSKASSVLTIPTEYDENSMKLVDDNRSRSSKDLNISDQCLVIESINDKFERICVKPDGNCLFRSLSYSLYGDENHHTEIRKNIVDYTVKIYDDVKELLLATCIEIEYKSSTHYKSIMEQDGVFGTDFEIGMFARLYKKRVILWKLLKNQLSIYAPIIPDEVDSEKSINIVFTGKLRSGHFDFLREKSYDQSPLKKQNQIMTKKPVSMDDSDTALDREVEFYLSHQSNKSQVIKDSRNSTCNSSSVTGEKTKINNKELSSSDSSKSSIDTDHNNLPVKQLNQNESYTNTFENNSINSSIYDFHDDDNELIQPYKPRRSEKIAKIDNTFDDHQVQSDFCPTLYEENSSKCETLSIHSSDDELSGSEENGQISQLSNSSSSKSPSDNESRNKKITAKSNNSSPKQSGKPNIYTEDYGFVDVLTYTIAHEDYIDISLLRKIIHDLMETEIRCLCPLSFYGGIRRNGTFWVMYARCYVRSHSGKFRFDIYERDENYIRIYVSSNTKLSDKNHGDQDPVCRPIKGYERKELMKLIKYRSAKSVHLENIQKCDRELLADGHGQSLHSLQVYHKIKSEAACAERKRLKSRDIEDIIQSFIDDSTKADPFIRQVSLPLQVLLYSRAQLNTVTNYKTVILHFDSTGANVNNPQFIKKGAIFYYCLIFRASKSAIPIAEMITSQHDIPSISVFLKKYKAFVHRELDIWPLAKAIVTDWSWALMNSIMLEWNGINIEQYLEIAYTYVTAKIVPESVTFLLSCCAHTMHRVSRIIKREFTEFHKIKSFLLECMALLILCRDFEIMNTVFRNILEIILTKNKESIKTAFNLLGMEKGVRRQKESVNDLLKEAQELEDKELELDDEFLKLYSKSKAVYTNSPFFKHFWKQLGIATDRINEKEENIEEITNPYYAPKFADFLTIHFMPYCPIWSCLMIDLVDPNISRVSNAYVEARNKTYKKIILKDQKRNTIGDVCRALCEYNQYLVAEEELENIKNKGKMKITHIPIYPETASNPLQTEKWGRKQTDIALQKTKKKRHAHMEGKHIIKINRKLNEDGDTDIEDDKKQSKEKKTKKRSLKIENKYKIKRAKKNMPNNNQACVDEDTIPQQNKSQETSDNGTLKTLSNGLVSDVLYYLLSRSKSIKVSSHPTTENCTVIYKRFELSVSSFKRLGSLTAWLNGDIIDAYIACQMADWKNVTYFPTEIGGTVLGKYWEKKHSKKLKLMNIQKKLNAKLLIPYSFNFHWRLLVVEPAKCEIALMDPYGTTSDSKRVFKAFRKYIKESNDRSTIAEMRDIDWKMIKITNCPLQQFSDGSNCGLYIIHYMESIGKRTSFDTNFNPENFRQIIAETLIKKSESVQNKCLHCLGTFDEKKSEKSCIVCKRRIHEHCIQHNLEESEEEQEIESYEKCERKKPIDTNKIKFFQCKLCQKYQKQTRKERKKK